jgi:predicted helicase
MQKLTLKPSHKHVKEYYESLRQFKSLNVTHETAVRSAFQNLLEARARQFDWKLVPEWPVKRSKARNLRVDGALLDEFRLAHGYWEAKDGADDLPKEVRKKLNLGYPSDNIIFQAPERAILWQDGRQVADEDITEPSALVKVLTRFFEYQPPAYAQWKQAVADFKSELPKLGSALTEQIEKARKSNARFREAFAGFYELCRQSINPNLSEQAVEEMLIQHILTERIFRTVFKNSDFTRRNVIAHEIEKVIDALTAQAFSREEFLRRFDHFYRAIEQTAATIEDFGQKQEFLNSVYEKFFQGFSVKVADTHGIVYTPQPIVNFMVRSVADILRREFGKSLGSRDVHILDPFVGTGNFIVRVMQEMKRTELEHKYKNELHCNEVMLLPYYIASMNIEHEFYELTGTYEPFEGICLVDTFELAEAKQISFFATENTERVERQKRSPITVVIGNPPYNVGQLNENDNNKNRKYRFLDSRVAETYAKDSKATNKNSLSDPYVKAIRWASDRIGDEGIVAFVTNNSFVDNLAFDGMRKHLEKDFEAVYVIDLGGNVRKNPKLSGTTHNVFGIQVGVSVNIFVRKRRGI